MRKKRITRYGRPISLPLEPEVFRDLQAEADRNDWPLTEVARQSIAVGLPLVKDRLRKRRKAEGKEDGNGDGTDVA